MGYHDLPQTPELDVVRIVSCDRNKVLLVQEVDDPNWKYPGGKIQAGETILEAACREALEELGVRLDQDMIRRYLAAPIPQSDHIRHMFLVSPIDPTVIASTPEVAQAGYFALDALPETKFHEHIISGFHLLEG